MQTRLKTNININVFAQLFLYAYIFMVYNANGVVFPQVLSSIFLSFFLLIGVLFLTLRKDSIVFSTHTKWYLCLVLTSFIMFSYSPEKLKLEGAFYWMIVALVISFLTLNIIKSRREFENFCWCNAISSFVLNFSLYLTGNLVGTYTERLGASIMGNSNIFSSLVMIATLYELWLITYGTYKTPIKAVLLVFILLNVFSLVLSAGRKCFVVPFVFLFFLQLFKTDSKKRQHTLQILFLFLILGFATYQLMMKVPIFYDSIGYRMETLQDGLSGESDGDGSFIARNQMIKMGLEHWIGSPIWGYGFNSFKHMLNMETGRSAYSHCNYVELLYNGGVIYFLLYYWLYYHNITTAFTRNDIERKYRSFVISVIISVLVYELGGVTYWNLGYVLLLSMTSTCLSFTNGNEEKVASSFSQYRQNLY